MIKRTKLLLLGLLIMAGNAAMAQREVEMADTLRSNGKIYVVVTVLCIIFVGIVAYLIHLDRKIGKLEKERNK